MKKKIFITGITSGIGNATATLLANEGHEVFGCGRRKGFADPKIKYASLDITDSQALARFVKDHQKWFEGLDVLVNNAGLALGLCHFQDQTAEDLETVLKTNVFSVLEITRLLLPFMVKKHSGQIINMGSIAGKQAYENSTLYCTTKAAIHHFTEGLKRDLTGSGVRVSTIAPGKVRTSFSAVRFRGDQAKAKKAYEGYQPLEAHDIAEIVSWVISRPAHVEITDLTVLAADQVDAVQIRAN